MISILILFVWFIIMFNSSTKYIINEDKNENIKNLENEIVKILKKKI